MARKIIVDGDFGGDEMQLLAVLLAHSEKFEIIGATSVFGNTSHVQVLKNAGSILRLLNADHIVPRFPGAENPSDSPMGEGDNAHGADGVGGVALPLSAIAPENVDAADFICQSLLHHAQGDITITATGPLTNIARAFNADPDAMSRVREIVIMGGCTSPIPAADMPFRSGNITRHAEFNFYMAARDAKTVMDSGLPIVLFPMNCTHRLTFTPEYHARLQKSLSFNPEKSDSICRMMRAAEELDMQKFASANVMHDVHTALYLYNPSFYEGRRGTIHVLTEDGDEYGKTVFTENPHGNVFVMEKSTPPNTLFDVVQESLVKSIS